MVGMKGNHTTGRDRILQIVRHARRQFQWEDDADLIAACLHIGLWYLTLNQEEKKDEKVVSINKHRRSVTGG